MPIMGWKRWIVLILPIILALLAALAWVDAMEEQEEEQNGMKARNNGENVENGVALLKMSDLKYDFERVDEVNAEEWSMDDIWHRAKMGGKPFVVRGIIKKPPLNVSDLPMNETVVLSRFVRRLPVTPTTSRLYPFDRVKGRLGTFLRGHYLDYMEWFSPEKGQQIFMVKRSIDVDYVESELDRLFWDYFSPFIPLPQNGSAAGIDPSYRIQASPFTYPIHFDCCDNWAFQARGGGGKRFYLHPPDDRIGGGFEEVDRLEYMFDEAARNDGSWRQRWLQADLREGDGVFIPLGWYHGVISDGSTRFCLSFNSPIDWGAQDTEYQDRIKKCDHYFAELYPQQEVILDEGIDYYGVSLIFWRRLFAKIFSL